MDRLEVSTNVYLPPQEVYEFLLCFREYAGYTEHLREVRQHGDGSPGTQYELDFSWWRLDYTARSEVTAVEPPGDADPPYRIDWRAVEDIAAAGSWLVEPVDPSGPETDVTFAVEYAPQSADTSRLELPRFVPFDAVVERAKPYIENEAERLVKRVVADLEGQQRDVALEIETQ